MTVDLTLILAIWGALVSTVLAWMKIAEYRKDRPIVRVTIKPGMKAFPDNTVYGAMTLLIVDVANVGGRPVSVTHVSLMLPRGQGYLL